jgi:hypothetical protein
MKPSGDILAEVVATSNCNEGEVLPKDAFPQLSLNIYTVKIERKSLPEKVERFRGLMANGDCAFQEGLLTAWEMMNLDLNVDLAVLAACETAPRREERGKG